MSKVNGGFFKVKVSNGEDSARSKKSKLLGRVERGEVGLEFARKVWESDSELMKVCKWSEVLDRRYGRSKGKGGVSGSREKTIYVKDIRSDGEWGCDDGEYVNSEEEVKEEEEVRDVEFYMVKMGLSREMGEKVVEKLKERRERRKGKK